VSWSRGVHQVGLLVVLGILRLTVYLVCVWLVRSLQQDRERLHLLATADVATGLHNRRGFNELTDAEIKRSLRHGRALSLLYLDVDDFKNINDRYGHSVGDAVLTMIADLLRSAVRAEDVIARIGGDEFAILLPETDHEGAAAVAANITTRLRLATPPDPILKEHPLTVSIGQVSGHHQIPDLAQFVRLADEDMYRHKIAADRG
jgi:diguanylate cyclase (GGDEF)-like protein